MYTKHLQNQHLEFFTRLTELNHRCEAFSQWKARFNSVYEHFIPKQLTSLVPSVKIAVLNTGIDLDNEYIEAHKERISGHNWLTEPKSKRLNDKHGHGTHIAGLILDLIPHSQLYIAKVTDGGDADPETLAGVSTNTIGGNEPPWSQSKLTLTGD